MMVIEISQPGSIPRSPASESDVPLVVDLDGTLIATDVLWESVLLLVRSRPLALLKAPLWLCRGKACLKEGIAARVAPDPRTLPYRQDVLDFLRAEHVRGRRIILATASDQRVAESVAAHLGFFEAIIGTCGGQNCRGAQKVELVRKSIGSTCPFDYIGDSSADFPVWGAARQAMVVGGESSVARRLARQRSVERSFEATSNQVKSFVRAMRPHQWAKNLLLFVPLVMGHEVHNIRKLVAAVAVFVAMSLIASAVYLVNDLLDLPADRSHATKRNRPFASGALSIPVGLAGALTLTTVGLTIGWSAGGIATVGMLALYIALSNLYSFDLKRRSLLDVMTLAALYTHRILTGSVATQIVPSFWLLAFSMFIFLSLALAKRYTELAAMLPAQDGLAGRGYYRSDLDLIRTLGPSSGMMAVLILCLYINEQQTHQLYQAPWFLWLICPVLVYWIMRVWLRAQRRQLNEDPVLFALKDWVSHLAGFIVAGLLALAVFGTKLLPW